MFGGVCAGDALLAQVERHAPSPASPSDVVVAMLSDHNQGAVWQQLEAMAQEPAACAEIVDEIVHALWDHASISRVAHRGMRALMILGGAGESVEMVVLRGGVEAIAASMRKHKSGAFRGCVQVSGCGALCALAASSALSQKQTDLAINTVIMAMDDAPWWDINTQSWGCRALGLFAARHSTQVAGRGGTRAVLSAMEQHKPNAALQETAFRALHSLAADPDARIDVARHGGAQALLASLAHHRACAQVQQPGLRTLSAIAGDFNLRGMVASLGGVEAAVAAMAALRRHPGVQALALQLLASLARTSASARVVASAGGIEAATSAIELHRSSSQVLKCACRALACIAVDAQCRTRVACAGGVEAVLAAMRALPTSEEVQKFGAGALAIMCGALQSLDGSAGDGEARRRVAQGGGPALVRAAMVDFAPNAVIQHNGRALLEALGAQREPDRA
jgi:hypothetical protein